MAGEGGLEMMVGGEEEKLAQKIIRLLLFSPSSAMSQKKIRGPKQTESTVVVLVVNYG